MKKGMIYSFHPKIKSTEIISSWKPSPKVETAVINQLGKLLLAAAFLSIR